MAKNDQVECSSRGFVRLGGVDDGMKPGWVVRSFQQSGLVGFARERGWWLRGDLTKRITDTFWPAKRRNWTQLLH
jgi:hypothetical protein